MALIRVTCPTCRAELELDARHAGQEVECGSCLQVFVAERPGGERLPAPPEPRRPRNEDEDDRPSRRPRRDDDDEADRPSRRPRRDDDEGEDDRPRRRRRRREEDDEYAYDPYDRPSGGGTGLAVTSLVLGILSIPLACCCGALSLPFSIGGAVCGGIGMRQEEGKGMAIAGLILNIIAAILAGILLIVGVGLNLANFK